MTTPTPDRRSNQHPHPVPGMPDRRHCSDEECRAARDLWYTETLLPKLMIRFYIGVAGTVVALAGIFMFLSATAITQFELKAKDLYESQSHHDSDVSRIERKVDEITAGNQSILNALDRNLAEIRDVRR